MVAIWLSCLSSGGIGTLGLAMPATAPTPIGVTDKNSQDHSHSPEIQKSYTEPRVRYVLGTKAIVRSGPSERYYATGDLAARSRVEVYLETTDGWSGIRPPEDSYNWILAKHAYLLPGGKVAEISDDETPAWVGSDAANIKQLMWQTALYKSQQVQILGEEHRTGEDGTKQLWYRIGPPQGEFRWIRSSALTDQMPASSIPNSGPESVTNQGQIALASFSQPAASPPIGSGVSQAAATQAVDHPSDGKIVWSDESEVVARINQEIKREQSEFLGQVPKGVATEEAVFLGEEQFEDEAYLIEEAMTPEELRRAQRRQQAQHQIDSLQHWDSLQNDPRGPLKAKPLRSILGLVGFSVIEAERAPVNTEMRRSMHGFHQPSSTRSMPNQYSSNRLDRLPRPGQKNKPYRPSSTDDPDDAGYYDDRLGASFEDDYRPVDEQLPIMQCLLSSNQPLFGGQAAFGGQSASYNPSNNYEANAGPRGIGGGRGLNDSDYRERDNAGWHAVQSPSFEPQNIAQASYAPRNTYEEPLEDAKFTSPEVQRSLLELSRVVSQPTETWDLGRLRARCMDWIEHGDSAIIRGEARLLLDRIDRFEDLRIKSLQSAQRDSRDFGNREPTPSIAPNFNPRQPGTFSGQSPVVQASGVMGTSVAPPNYSQPPNYPQPSELGAGDASGWLVQVHATAPGQPDFALTDDAGNVITYVRSTASLNLRRYLQQPVMIQGVRGYIPNLAAKQIVAERVVRLR